MKKDSNKIAECKNMNPLFKHQKDALDAIADKPAFALLSEPGTGKSRIVLEDACGKFNTGWIDALIIIAPAGVDRKWRDECEKWIPEFTPWSFHLWKSSATKSEIARRKEFHDDKRHVLKILSCSTDSIVTASGFAFIGQLMQTHKAMLVIDESTRIKNPKAFRTKAALKLGPMANYRRILTGTPITQNVADIYSQFQFLDPDIIGIKSYFAFKKRYMYESTGYGPGGRTFQKFTGIRNEKELLDKIAPYSFRITKAECLDLPPKIYERWYVDLSNIQRKAYEELKENFITEMSSGKSITAEMALTRFGKLQQILGGFLNDDGGISWPLDDAEDAYNPRIEAVFDIIEGHAEKTKFVIWAKFKYEIKDITAHLRDRFGRNAVVEYHGDVETDNRHDNVQRFQTDPECLFFVANARTAGIGLDLYAASNVIYYSNTFSLEERLQSEDRCHRQGQVNKVTYYDLEAVNTIDGKILTALYDKKSLADMISDSLKNNKNIY